LVERRFVVPVVAGSIPVVRPTRFGSTQRIVVIAGRMRVMAGLDPATHAVPSRMLRKLGAMPGCVDGRVKPGHDD
jgi:hypothetical protein